MTDQIGSGTAQGVIDYLDSLVDKGRSRPGVVTPLKTAVTKVLEATEGEESWGSTDVVNLDIDDVMVRFKNKTLSKYTSASYSAYQSRVTRAVSWYKKFLDNPGWAPKENARTVNTKTVKKSNTSKTSKNVGAAIVTDNPHAGQQSQKFDAMAHSFPLANGETVRLYVPKGLTEPDVQRLTMFLNSLIIEK